MLRNVYISICCGSSLIVFSSVQLLIVSDSLRPHELQNTRPPCTSPTPGVGGAIQPSHPLLSPSPPALSLSQHQGLFKWVNSSHQVAKVLGASASASVLPMNIQDWFPLEWTGWISLQSKGLSRVFSNTTFQKHQFFGAQVSSQSNSHLYMTTGKTITLTRWTFVGKVMSQLFNMLSRLVITFLPRSKHLLISWLQSPSCSDLGGVFLKQWFPLFPHLFAMKWRDQMPWS